MAYGRKYYKEFDGYNAAIGQTYTVLVDIYEDGFAGTAIEIEEISASPLQLSLDSSGDPLYTAIKKTSATFNIINTGQFDYSEFYTSNAKKYKMMITSPVFNWTGYLVPQAVSFDLATNGEFSLTASDGLHLLQSIDYVAAENDMTTLADFLTDIETKIGLSTFNRTSTVNTEYGDIWNSLIYEGMFTNKTYEEAFEMVLKAIGMQVRYWKITPIISMESALQTASVKCVNDYPELNFLAPIKTAKLTKNITTLPNALKGAMVDDVTDITDRLGGYYTLSNWVIAANNGLPVSPNELQLDAPTEKYKAINVFAKPTNLPYDVSLSGDMHSYFNVRPIRSSQLTLVFSANFGRLGRYAKFVSGEGFKSFVVPVKWSTIRWSLYDTVSNKSFNKTSGAWDITGVPTKATSNEIKVTNPADSYVDILVEVATPPSITNKLRFYLFTSDFEASSVPDSYGTQFSRLSIKEIKLDGVEVVSDNELYTATIGNVAVGDNIDKLSYEVDFGSVPVPPLNTSLYYGSAFFDNNLNQLEDIIIGANTVSHEQYLFNTILYTQNEIRKKVYTANVNMLTNVSPFWLKTTLKTDTVMVNACSFDFKTSQLNGEFTEIMPYVYREWNITSESEIGSSDWGGSGGTTGTSGGGGTSIDTSNFVVKTGAVTQNIEGSVTVEGAVVAGATNNVLPDDLPVATGSLYGVVKIDDVTIKIDANGKIYAIATGGVSSWNDLTDKPANLVALASLTGAGIVKRNSDGSFSLDTSAYLTAITKTMVENVLTGDITTHTHSQYLLASSYTAADVLSKILTVDGTGSGLDADLLDGQHGSFYFNRNTLFNANNVDYNAVNYEIGHGVTTQPIHLPNYTGAVNAPFSSYGQMIHFDGSSFFPFRIAFDYTGRMFFQGAGYKPNGPYNYSSGTPWLEFFHSGNSNKKTVDWNAKDLKCVNTIADGAVVAGALNGTLPDDLPVATSSLFGVIKTGASINNNAGLVNINGRHYTTTTVYTDSAVREITAEIPIGTGTLAHTEAMSLQLPFLPSSTTKTVTGNILINPTTWAGTVLNVTFLNNGTNYVAFITNYSGSTITKDGIKITVMAKQTI